jgi:alpha-tubulin suppressor-like RCC1 family protein
MAATGNITTKFIDEKGVDLGKTLIEKDYLISVYPNILNQFDTPMLMGWGVNQYGQLGDNTIIWKSSSVQTIAYGANWKQVSSGLYYCAAIKTDGTLWAWGSRNDINFQYGVLGDNATVNRSSPVQTVAGGTNWKSVACGYANIAAIKTDGTLWVWGSNRYGTLGDNTTTNLFKGRSSPVQTIAGGTNWKQVACGTSYVAAIKTDGTLWTWGSNIYGNLGDNTVVDKSSPVQTVAGGTNWKQVSCGNSTTAAIKNDGTLWCWGWNVDGELGINISGYGTNRSSPVQTVAFGTNWKQVSAGYHIAAIKTDGTLWTWGTNTNGQLGDNTTVNRSSPVQTIAFGTNWKSVAFGLYHIAAIKTDGTLWTWGYNYFGQLGDGTIVSKSSPIQTIAFGINWKSVAVSYGSTFAIKDGDF